MAAVDYAFRRISETWPAPTLDPTTGRPVDWAPTSVVDEAWGLISIWVDGVNVTLVRGVPTELADAAWQEPFGDGPATLLVPGGWLYDWGSDGFEWLREEADVQI